MTYTNQFRVLALAWARCTPKRDFFTSVAASMSFIDICRALPCMRRDCDMLPALREVLRQRLPRRHYHKNQLVTADRRALARGSRYDRKIG